MRKSRFTTVQSVGLLREQEAGAHVRGHVFGDRGETNPESLATITLARAYFGDRKGEVAKGFGNCGTPYEFSFDWVVVLDPAAGGVFSFVSNLED